MGRITHETSLEVLVGGRRDGESGTAQGTDDELRDRDRGSHRSCSLEHLRGRREAGQRNGQHSRDKAEQAQHRGDAGMR